MKPISNGLIIKPILRDGEKNGIITDLAALKTDTIAEGEIIALGNAVNNEVVGDRKLKVGDTVRYFEEVAATVFDEGKLRHIINKNALILVE
jgi:co-chaperonin GroES (HSP10)